MATAKISITVDTETLAWMRKRARRRKRNLSAAFVEAIRQVRQLEARAELLKRLGAQRLTPDQVAKIAAEWED